MMTRIILTLLAMPNWVGGLILMAWAVCVWFAARWLRIPEAERLAWQWILSYDQHGNALAFGDKDEYISTRAGRCASRGLNRPCYWICRVLHLLDPDHCTKSILADIEEADSVRMRSE